MIRWLTTMAMLAVILSGMVVAHKRLNHIETALGINAESPDGQVYQSFVAVMNALTHLHNDMEAHDRKDRELQPLQEKKKNQPLDVYSAKENL